MTTPLFPNHRYAYPEADTDTCASISGEEHAPGRLTLTFTKGRQSVEVELKFSQAGHLYELLRKYMLTAEGDFTPTKARIVL